MSLRMDRILWTAALLIAAGMGSVLAEADRPNVLLIYSDDQGAVDLGCYGSADLETPHLDTLARRGVRFSQMYAPSAICSASRAGLLTGRYPVRAGVPGNVSSMKGRPGMPTEEVTIAEMLRSAGYATGHIGKWHLGYTPETMPNGQGFDESFGHMGGCIDNFSHFFYWNGPNRHDLWRNGEVLNHLDDLGLTEETIVIFQSDHGHSTEERAFFGGGNPGPFRGAKGCLFEGGIRVPSIISWPGRIPVNQVRDQLTTGCDWFPTLAEFCGVRDGTPAVDGRSLVSVICDESAPGPHDRFFWHLGSGPNAQWAVREGPWKLLGNPRDTSQTAPLGEDDDLFLAHLIEDPGERSNLAASHPEQVRRLKALRDGFVKDAVAGKK